MSAPTTPPVLAPADVRHKAQAAGLNATFLFVLAYLMAETLYRLATVLVAAQLRIPGAWQLGRLQFLISNADWWRGAVVKVYGAGPLACLLLAAAAGLWFWKRARFRRGLGKQFLFWLLVHGLNLFFGALVADTITRSGFWFVPSWLLLAGNIPNVVLAVVFGVVLAVLGYLAGPLFLLSHDSRTLMRYEQRRTLLLATLLAPWLLGSLLIGLLRFPELTVNECLHLASLLLLLGPLALASAGNLFEFTLEVPQKTRVAWGLAALLLLAAAALRLGAGFTFG